MAGGYLNLALEILRVQLRMRAQLLLGHLERVEML